MKAIGYVRVSTEEQGEGDLGLSAQREAVQRLCSARGWELARIREDVASGRSRKGRPGLAQALEEVAAERGVLVVAKLDRLARSVVDFGGILAEAKAGRWALAVADLDVDTSKPTGKMLANIVMTIAEWERDMIAQRTVEALTQKAEAGATLGRPVLVPRSTTTVVAHLRWERGLGYKAIARALNETGVPTPGGGTEWRPSSVRSALRQAARREVTKAVADGRLEQAGDCESCHDYAERLAQGLYLHAHHDDYDRPLEVRWLCPSCHKREHQR